MRLNYFMLLKTSFLLLTPSPMTLGSISRSNQIPSSLRTRQLMQSRSALWILGHGWSFIAGLILINDSKTVFLIMSSRGQLSKINDSSIGPVKSVRNLGSWFDEHMIMVIHIRYICSKAFKGLYNIELLTSVPFY